MRDAADYLGMDRHIFNKQVRPYLRAIRIGIQGIAFDRLDLDAWVDEHVGRSECPADSDSRRMKTWDENERRVSKKDGDAGKLIKRSSDADFAKALALVTWKKLKST
jgi:hypothetical protein